MVRPALFVALTACAAPEYPKYKCEQLAAAPLDPVSYVRQDPRESLFADDRDAWKSSRCDPVRAALRPIDDAHDLEDATLAKECDEAATHVSPDALRSACRAGCWAQWRWAAEVAAWSRVLKGVAAWDPKRADMLAIERSCPMMKTPPKTKDALGRALWTCARLPLPPKRFEIGYDKRWKDHEPIGLESMIVSLYEDERRHVRDIEYRECSGAGSRWAIFGKESP